MASPLMVRIFFRDRKASKIKGPAISRWAHKKKPLRARSTLRESPLSTTFCREPSSFNAFRFLAFFRSTELHVHRNHRHIIRTAGQRGKFNTVRHGETT